jgi:hypothetical protein
MIRTLLYLLLSTAFATSAAAQAGGWDSPGTGWDTPKKSATKKSPVKKAAATNGQSQNAGQQPQNDGRTVSPFPSAPGQADANPGNTVSTPPNSSFDTGTDGAARGGNDSQGMSAAPGMPVMMRSGRSVLANEAAAARERRLLHQSGRRRGAASAVPAPMATEGTPAAGALPTGADAAAGSGNRAGGQDATPATPSGPTDAKAGSSTAPASSKPATKKSPAKKAPPAPAGW